VEGRFIGVGARSFLKETLISTFKNQMNEPKGFKNAIFSICHDFIGSSVFLLCGFGSGQSAGSEESPQLSAAEKFGGDFCQ